MDREELLNEIRDAIKDGYHTDAIGIIKRTKIKLKEEVKLELFNLMVING